MAQRPSSNPSWLRSAAARRPVASVSIDLDPLRCYSAIHGLAPPADRGDERDDPALAVALPRFLELCDRRGIKATLFVVGEEIDRERKPQSYELLRRAARAGHELGNHSHTHPYDLARRPRAQMEAELLACHQRLREVAGALPQGFRAPGYDLTPDLLDVAAALGYRYDSSIFPCPAYYAAKAAVMGAMRVLGRRRSQAVLTSPWSQLAPADPYRPDPNAPHRRGQATLVELPIAVTPGARLPAIGTWLIQGERLRLHLLEAMRRRPFFNLELHGMDLLGLVEDGLPAELGRHQPDLKVPLLHKLRALHATLDRLQGGYEIVPLREVAERVSRTGGVGR